VAEGDMFGSSDEEEFLTEILELGHNNGRRCSLFMTSMEVLRWGGTMMSSTCVNAVGTGGYHQVKERAIRDHI
jgi:hypothetical protein